MGHAKIPYSQKKTVKYDWMEEVEKIIPSPSTSPENSPIVCAMEICFPFSHLITNTIKVAALQILSKYFGRESVLTFMNASMSPEQ